MGLGRVGRGSCGSWVMWVVGVCGAGAGLHVRKTRYLPPRNIGSLPRHYGAQIVVVGQFLSNVCGSRACAILCVCDLVRVRRSCAWILCTCAAGPYVRGGAGPCARALRAMCARSGGICACVAGHVRGPYKHCTGHGQRGHCVFRWQRGPMRIVHYGRGSRSCTHAHCALRGYAQAHYTICACMHAHAHRTLGIGWSRPWAHGGMDVSRLYMHLVAALYVKTF